MTAPIRHVLLIRNPSCGEILLAAGGQSWTLPRFDFDERPTAEVDYINHAVHEQFALEATVLRCLSHSVDSASNVTTRFYELEFHGAASLPASLRWFGAERLAPTLSAGNLELLDQFHAAGQPPREWCKAGWWSQACAWLRQALGRLGIKHIERFIQRRTWDFSCVIQVCTAAGDFYFKALPGHGAEWEVTNFLSGLPHLATAAVVAGDRERRWLLMRAFEGESLNQHADFRQWERAVASYAQIQLESARHTAQLAGLGCATFELASLEQGLVALLHDNRAMMAGEPGGLSAEQIVYLRDAEPWLRAGCRRLAESPVPFTLDHGDLWPSNILAGGGRCIVIDWEDARITHPFLSLAPLLAGLEQIQPETDLRLASQTLRTVYLRAYTEFAQVQQLAADFDTAQALAMLEIAVRYWRQPAATVAIHPWMREMVPYFCSLPFAKLKLRDGWPV